MAAKKVTWTVTNLKTGRSYPILADPGKTFETIWSSQKYKFMPKTSVMIVDPLGRNKVYTKKE